MPKPLLEDMVKRKPASRTAEQPRAEQKPKIQAPIPVPRSQPIGTRPRYLLWTVAALSVAFLVLAISFLFSRARVDVYPKTLEAALDENFTANKKAPGSGLSFDLVALSGTKQKALQASEEKEAAFRAEGTVVIFNSFSAAAQRLDVDTRLSGSNGKLYKTKTQVTVPGKKADGTPGSAEVEIYAADTGADYNSGPLDFQIVGFKGTSKYDAFKVRTKPGTEISGGFRGITSIASDADKAAALADVTAALRDELSEKAASEIPAGFILWKGAAVFHADKAEFSLGGEEQTLILKGTLYGLLFDEKEITKKIAEKKIKSYDGSEVFIPELRDLRVALSVPPDTALENLDTVTFNLSGPATIVWKVDAEKLLADLAGESKKNFISIVSKYKNIDRAELDLSPLWKRSVPERKEDIRVVVHYPEKD